MPSTKAKPADSQTQLRAAKILVVEDGETNRRLMQIMLQRLGQQVVEAENGQIAVTLVEQQSFDVILMDMQMPVKDGYTAATELRAKRITTPIVALTAHAMPEDEKRCLDAGCSDYLTKPVTEDRLIATLARYIGMAAILATPTISTTPERRLQTSLQSTLPTEFADLVAEFVKQFGPRTAVMQSSLRDKRFNELQQQAQWFKETGGTVGFDQFTQPAACLESSANESDIETAQAALDDILELIDCIRGADVSLSATGEFA